MSSLFNSLKEKAQAAANAHGFGRSDGDGESAQGKGGPMAGIMSSHTVESLSHQFRTIQQQYSSSTTPVQKIITTTKGIAIDFDNVSRDAQAHSKELYLWGQTEADDLKDVTDRLAWLSFMQGALAGTLATKIDKSRATFKDLRASENAQAPRRNIRISLENQIARMEHEQRKDLQARLQEMKAQLRKNEEEDLTAEKDIEVLKRKAVRESEQEKWEAIREYAEKLSMVAQAALSIVPALPASPPTKSDYYNGSDTTASVRASLQKALDSYSPGNIGLILATPTGADLKHTRSFGETHANELSHIDLSAASVTGNIPITPPPPGSAALPPQAVGSQSRKPIPLPVQASALSAPPPAASSPTSLSPPLNPANLNQAPAPIPPVAHATSSFVAPDPADPSTKVPLVTPTVAETGVPKVAGPEGPGPATGSLLDKHATSSPSLNPFGSSPPQPKWESAEEEKKRLQREEREWLLTSGTSGDAAPAPYESAEEEKKRLEREERERVLRQGGSGGHNTDQDPPPHEDVELPPYKEF